MNWRKHHNKVDENQAEIVRDLRLHGAIVDIVSSVPKLGYDLVVQYRGQIVKVEVKRKDGKLTESEKAAQLAAGEKYAVITNIQESRGLLANIREYQALEDEQGTDR